MVRFKVVKGSHLLLAFAAIALLAVIALILIQSSAETVSSAAQDVSETVSEAEIVQLDTPDGEAKAAIAFASNLSVPPLRIEVVSDVPTPSVDDSTTVLIYHTHTHEAYDQVSDDPYDAIETWRTVDESHSVVRVGSALADALEDLGYRVIHDTTDHEQDALSSAYDRSLETLQRYTESFDLRIDLHRDAYVDGLMKHFAGPDGAQYAQLMLLVGRGDEYSGDERPPYEENLAFAQRLTTLLNEETPGICRNVTVKKGRYNQHVDQRCILVEVGHNLNTLQEALASVPTLAKGIDGALREFCS